MSVLSWLTYLVYRMLEDPSYESIVRWGEGGESFVVLEVCRSNLVASIATRY
jgi:hypothetical protein